MQIKCKTIVTMPLFFLITNVLLYPAEQISKPWKKGNQLTISYDTTLHKSTEEQDKKSKTENSMAQTLLSQSDQIKQNPERLAEIIKQYKTINTKPGEQDSIQDTLKKISPVYFERIFSPHDTIINCHVNTMRAAIWNKPMLRIINMETGETLYEEKLNLHTFSSFLTATRDKNKDITVIFNENNIAAINCIHNTKKWTIIDTKNPSKIIFEDTDISNIIFDSSENKTAIVYENDKIIVRDFSIKDHDKQIIFKGFGWHVQFNSDSTTIIIKNCTNNGTTIIKLPIPESHKNAMKMALFNWKIPKALILLLMSYVGLESQTIFHDNTIEKIQFSFDSNNAVALYYPTHSTNQYHCTIEKIDLTAKDREQDRKKTINLDPFYSYTINSTGNKIFASKFNELLKLIDLIDGEQTSKIISKHALVHSFSPDGNKAMIISEEAKACIIDFTINNSDKQKIFEDINVRKIKFSSDGQKAIIWYLNPLNKIIDRVKIIDLTTTNPKCRILFEGMGAKKVIFNATVDKAMVIYNNNSVQGVDLVNWHVTNNEHSQPYYSLWQSLPTSLLYKIIKHKKETT